MPQSAFEHERNNTCRMPDLRYLGDLSVDGDKVKVEWSEKEIARARNTNIGIYEHYNEIQNMIKVCVPKLVANKDTLPKMMEKYEKFDETIANM
uniref:hypothetical protein n=1 Tax=Mediterraneibacter glycyrrhizinilyticus TaxID=342942 RepID=UPI00351BF77A